MVPSLSSTSAITQSPAPALAGGRTSSLKSPPRIQPQGNCARCSPVMSNAVVLGADAKAALREVEPERGHAHAARTEEVDAAGRQAENRVERGVSMRWLRSGS